MDDAYDCEYDMVDDPIGMLQEAHARIRELEAAHADEIDRLRLTDAEREAIVAAIHLLLDDPYAGAPISPHAATLRGLLDRLGSE